METNPRPNIKHILVSLQGDPSLKRQAVEGNGLDPEMAMLRQWQADRLSRTYLDLQANERYMEACSFFLTDIYAAQDFSHRDAGLEQAYDLLQRFVPASMLVLLADSIELNQLTHALDERLLRALVDRLGVNDSITPAQYAEAYRVCDNYAERVRQIDLLVKVLRVVGEGARKPGVGTTLHLGRLPASRAGWGDMVDFLIRGYVAFRKMKGAEEFVGIIETREKEILERIFSGDADPFRQGY
jgi:hypothetical protein